MGRRPGLAFVLCPAFHGATLLALLLNNHWSISALGDTNPERGYDQTCACGATVSACPFWQAVSEATDSQRFSELRLLLPMLPWPLSNRSLEGGFIPVSRSATLNRMVGRTMASGADLFLPVLWRAHPAPVGSYVETWETFYRTVRELHGTHIVVDGSKLSRKAKLLTKALSDQNDARVIHLLRDPRGFVASARRHDGGADIRQHAWLWESQHRRIASLGSAAPYLRVRYEDLALDPEPELVRILDFLGLEHEPLIGPPRFPEKHHLMGNSMMFGFDGRIRLDERWRETLTRDEQREVLNCAGTFARACGYA